MTHRTDIERERAKWDNFYSALPFTEEDDAQHSFNVEFARHISELLPNGGKSFEAGCGAAYQSLALARTGKFDVTVMDFADGALSYARRAFEREGAEATYIRGNALEHGQPEYDLVFNAGTLEHYTFEEQVRFVQAMASRSRRYVLVLVPNSECYWYWIRRVQDASDSIWAAGKEVPLANLSAVFDAAGLRYEGQAYLGQEWAEALIKTLPGVTEETRQQILQIHRTPGLLSSAQKGYLFAALGSVPAAPHAQVPSVWSQLIGGTTGIETETRASLADALALRIASERELKAAQRQLADTREALTRAEDAAREAAEEGQRLASQGLEQSHRVDEYANNVLVSQQQVSALTALLIEREESITRLVRYVDECERVISSYQNAALRKGQLVAESSTPESSQSARVSTNSASSAMRYRASRRMVRFGYRALVPYSVRVKVWERRHRHELGAIWSQQTQVRNALAAATTMKPIPEIAKAGARQEPIKPRTAKAGRRKRVAYLTNQVVDWTTGEPRFGGGERYCATLGNLLQSHGLDVTVYQPAYKTFESEYYGLPVKTMPLGESYSEFMYGACDTFTRITDDYDFVIHNLPEYSSGRVRPDALVMCHGLWFDHDNYPSAKFRSDTWFEHFYRAFSQPGRVVSVDANSINFIRGLYPSLTERMTYIPNWVDTNMFAFPAHRNLDSKVVIFPRRKQVNRGSRILGAILDSIPHEDWEFWWVGDGDEHETRIIEDVARRDKRLKLFSAPLEGMPDFYQRAAIAAIPTIGSEGTSLSCLEAMACGCAVVTTHVGGLSNLVISNVNGVLADPTPASIARGINHLIEHPEERMRLQMAGNHTAQQFDFGVWRNRWVELLQDMDWI